MTRINCIPPSELCRQHLVAEYRELPRVFKQALAAKQRGEKPDDPRNPTEYVLGTGHVRFFYNKCGYLILRQVELTREMQNRGFATSYSSHSKHNLAAVLGMAQVQLLGPEWLLDWTPTPKAQARNRARIAERLATMGNQSA